MILAGDIGGTKTNRAYFDDTAGSCIPVSVIVNDRIALVGVAHAAQYLSRE